MKNLLQQTIYIFILILFFSCKKTETPMNVVVLFTDDQRFNTIHAWGNDVIHTPNMDRLVQMGVSFKKAHIMGSHHGGVCAPSRAMLLSGKPYMNIPKAYIDMGVTTPDTHFDFTTFPELLRAEGYETFFTGKWHNNTSKIREGFTGGDNIFIGGMHWPKDGGHRRPKLWHFDSTAVFEQKNKWQGEEFSSKMYSDAAVDFIQNRNTENPFCLYVAYTSPHDPREAPEEYVQLYENSNISLPKNYQSEHSFDNGHLRTRDENLAPFPRTEEIIKKEIIEYYAMISEVDAQIGRVLDALESKNLMENTIIVFAGDNGLAVGQHGLLGKQSVYEHSVRVPLVIAAPNIKGNQSSEALCYLYDVFPTICDILDLKIPSSVEGKSLRSILDGEKEDLRDHLFLAHAKEMRAVRTKDDWKLIQYFVHGKSREQLFNLNDDPWEINNLADENNHQEKKEALKKILMQNVKDYNDDFIRAYINIEKEYFDQDIRVSIASSFPLAEIRYTLDNSEPTANSTLFKKTFTVKEKTTPIKAALFFDGNKVSKTYFAEAKFTPRVIDLELSTTPAPKYAGKGKITLLNGRNGGEDFHAKEWLGFQEEDVTATVRLKSRKPLSEVGIRFLNHPGSWIFPPKEIKISVSDDGKQFKEIAKMDEKQIPSKKEAEVIELTIPIENQSSRFIKFEIKNQGICPDWHPGKGGKAWLFLDELIFN